MIAVWHRPNASNDIISVHGYPSTQESRFLRLFKRSDDQRLSECTRERRFVHPCCVGWSAYVERCNVISRGWRIMTGEGLRPPEVQLEEASVTFYVIVFARCNTRPLVFFLVRVIFARCRKVVRPFIAQWLRSIPRCSCGAQERRFSCCDRLSSATA